MPQQGHESRLHQLQQQLQESQRLLTDADARAADCAADARALKEANDHLADKLRDESADRRRADADKLKLADVVRSLMITNEQLMSRDARSFTSQPSPRDRSARSHSPHYLTTTFAASEHARLTSSRLPTHRLLLPAFLSRLTRAAAAPPPRIARPPRRAALPLEVAALPQLNCSKSATGSRKSCAC
jgi:hypothetical protein